MNNNEMNEGKRFFGEVDLFPKEREPLPKYVPAEPKKEIAENPRAKPWLSFFWEIPVIVHVCFWYISIPLLVLTLIEEKNDPFNRGFNK